MVRLKKKKFAGMNSDFVRNSHGESWESSCEKTWVPDQNHWDSVKKKTSSKLKKLGSLCDQAVTESEDRLQNSLSQCTEIKMQSSYWNNKNEGTKINTVHIVKQQPHLTATEIVRTGFSTKASSDRSTFASYGTQPLNYFASLRIFMRQGHRTQR